MRLKPAQPGPLLGRELPFPDAIPLGARFQEGALAIDPDEQGCRAEVRSAAVPTEPGEEGPWGKQIPSYYYPYRSEPVRGTVRLLPRPPQLRARCTSEVFVAWGQAAVETRLALEAVAGSVEVIDLDLSAPGSAGPWRVEQGAGRGPTGGDGEQVLRTERVHDKDVAGGMMVLGARDPLGTAVLFAARPPGEHWRLTLARPLRPGEPLLLQAAAKVEPTGGRWEVPLVTVPRADRMEGEVILHLAGAGPRNGEWVEVQAEGLREGTSTTGWRTFEYGHAASLTLRGQALTADRSAQAAVHCARLTTTVRADGALQHHFSFRVANWPQRTLPLRLPAGAQLLAAQVDGHWLRQPLLPPVRNPKHIRNPKSERDDPVSDVELGIAGFPPQGEGGVLELPVPGTAAPLPPVGARSGSAGANGERTAVEGVHHFEVVYTTAGPPCWMWARLEAPTPALPVVPASFRRTWRVPPGLTPLFDGRQRRLPGTGAGPDPRYRVGDLFRLPAGLVRSGRQADRAAGQKEALAGAVAQLSGRQPGRPQSLGEVVEQLAFEQLRGSWPVIVDTTALRAAGLGPETVLAVRPLPATAGARSGKAPSLPGEEQGLRVLAAGPAVLLTTQRQCDLWHDTGVRAAPASGDLADALAEAAIEGQDPSGRFRSALDWLTERMRDEGGRMNQTASSSSPSSFLLPPSSFDLAPWSEWEPVAGVAGDDELVVVRRSAVTAAGLGLAAAWGLGLWQLWRPLPRWRLGFLLLWLALAGLGLFWLPAALQDLAWWPLLTGCGVGLVWYLGTAWGRRASSHPHSAGGGAARAAALVVLAAVSTWGSVSTSAPVTVYVVPGPPEAPEQEGVLVPPDLLERLKELERGALPAGPAAVLVGANYDGKVKGGVAEFAAVFQAHCLTDGPTALALPLDGVRLCGELWLDGARTSPVALAPPQVGYTVMVRGRGRHKVELRFRVPLTAVGEERDIRFTAPRLAQSRLVLKVPPGAKYVQALVKYGAQRLLGAGADQRLEVDLGAVGTPLHLRWQQQGQTSPPPGVRVQEAYLWDLGVDASSLTALLRYQVSGGAILTLDMSLAPELVVRGAETRRADPAEGSERAAGTGSSTLAVEGSRSAGPVRLGNWRVSGANTDRVLRLEFTSPVSGEFLVVLDLVPREPLPATVTLPLPVPRGARVSGSTFLAYRTRGLEASPVQLLRITGINAADFAPFWPASSRPDPQELAYACTVRREQNQGPVLRVHLRVSPPVVSATQDVSMRVGRRQAEVRASAQLTAPGGDLLLVRWELRSPAPLNVEEVNGPDVLRWSQSGNHVLVWLRGPTRATRLELLAWLPLSAPVPGGRGTALELPCLRLLPARKQLTWLRLTSDSGLSLTPAGLRNLLPLPDTRPPGQESAYVSRRPDYGGTWWVRADAGVSARVLTFAEVRDRQLTFTAVVDYQAAQGEVRSAQVRLLNWEGEKVDLEAPRVAQRRERRRTPGDRAWSLELQPGITGHYRLTLRGSLPVEDAAGGVPMPDVVVGEVSRCERWLALAGGELTAEAGEGLEWLADPGRALADWPREAERVRRTNGSAWRVTGALWGLRLVPHDRAPEPAPVQVFLAQQRAAVVDGRRWLHETTFWLRHEDHTDLSVTLPADATVVAASVDGTEMAPLQPDLRRLWLPLPGRAGVRHVVMSWVYASPEALDQPNLERPRLEGAVEGPTIWTVYVPPGWATASSPAGLGSGAERVAAIDLYRAAAQLQISAELARTLHGGAGPELTLAQRRFYLLWDHAGRALEISGVGPARAAQGARARALTSAPHEAGDSATGPGGISLAEWRQGLGDRNRALARELGFAEVRAEAEQQARAGGGVGTGLPRNGEGAEVSPPPNGGDRGRERGDGLVLPEEGTPLSWQAGPSEPAPRLELTLVESGQTRRAILATGEWLGLLGVVWGLSLAPGLRARARLLWPEQVALAGGLGWYLAGRTPLVLGLLAVAAGGLVFRLGRGVLRLLRRPGPAPASAEPGNQGPRG